VTKGDNIVSTVAHNHMSDPGTVEGREAQLAVLKKAADNPKVKTGLLVEEFAARTEDPSFRTRTVTSKSLAKQIQRVKAKALHKPATPKSFDDLAEIPEEFQVHFHIIIRGFFANPDCRSLSDLIRIVGSRPILFETCCVWVTDGVVLVAVDTAGGPLPAVQLGPGVAHCSGRRTQRGRR
jgi:hypothetical protein